MEMETTGYCKRNENKNNCFIKKKTIASYKLTMIQIWERQTHDYLNFRWQFKAYISVTSECMFKTVYEKENKKPVLSTEVSAFVIGKHYLVGNIDNEDAKSVLLSQVELTLNGSKIYWWRLWFQT